MGRGFGPPQGRFQRGGGGGFGYRGGNYNTGLGLGPSFQRGANNFGSSGPRFGSSGPRYGGARVPSLLEANQGPRQPGFGSSGRGFSSFGGGRGRGVLKGGGWFGNVAPGSVDVGGGAMESFGFDQSAGDVKGESGSAYFAAEGQGYDNTGH